MYFYLGRRHPVAFGGSVFLIYQRTVPSGQGVQPQASWDTRHIVAPRSSPFPPCVFLTLSLENTSLKRQSTLISCHGFIVLLPSCSLRAQTDLVELAASLTMGLGAGATAGTTIVVEIIATEDMVSVEIPDAVEPTENSAAIIVGYSRNPEVCMCVCKGAPSTACPFVLVVFYQLSEVSAETSQMLLVACI